MRVQLCSLSVLAVLLAAFPCSSAPLPASAIPEYQVGQTSAVNIVAWTDLVVVEPVETAALKNKEAQRIPAIFLWNTNSATDALNELRAGFEQHRLSFLDRVEDQFQKRSLSNREVNSREFRALITDYRAGHQDFPLPSAMARLWARGASDAEYFTTLADALQEIAQRMIRPDDLSVEVKLGSSIKLVPFDGKTALSAKAIEECTNIVRRTSAISLAKARADLAYAFANEERTAVRYLSSLLKPNCIPDEAATLQARAEATSHLWSAARYKQGDIIVRAGQLVDEQAKAALDQLRRHAAANSTKLVQTLDWRLTMIVAGTTSLIAATLVVFFLRRQRPITMVISSSGASSTLSTDVRSQVVQTLSRFLKVRFVQRLLGDREHQDKIGQMAAAESELMEDRLQHLQVQIEERFRAYEQRIEELEKELATAGNESRDLIRARIALVKGELEREREQVRISWN